MDISKGSYYDKNTHLTSTSSNETDSSLSSDGDKTPKPPKKRKGKKASKKSFTPDYFPMYTPPWATMNFIYLDLMRQLSLESELRTCLTQMDKNLRGHQAKQKVKDEQSCGRRKMKHKRITCEDFEMSCSQLCFSCHKKPKCSSCVQTIMQSGEPETAVKESKHCCKCVHDSCPSLCDLQRIPLCHYRCQKSLLPCHSLNCNGCDSLNRESVDPPVRERPESCNISRSAPNSLDSEACNNSDPNLDKPLSEKTSGDDNCTAKNVSTENEPDSQEASKNVKKPDFENDSGIVPSFLGGTGDERSKHQVKCSKSIPQSTTYFLPVSALSTDESKMNFPRFNS